MLQPLPPPLSAIERRRATTILTWRGHVRLNKDDFPAGEEDELCRLALRYLLLNGPELVSVGRDTMREISIHLRQGPLQAGALGEENKPPFLWRYPIEVGATGPESGRITFAKKEFAPDLSAWSDFPPQRMDEVARGMTDALLADIKKFVCEPIIDAIRSEKSEKDAELFAKFLPKPSEAADGPGRDST